ncbi:hypothetical protein [Frankia sp. AiPs1]|uniref:hypothetical protein n=1 Tax=Frankia sp. AiPs1 TaxID=573493 RepID=UPI0035AC06F6
MLVERARELLEAQGQGELELGVEPVAARVSLLGAYYPRLDSTVGRPYALYVRRNNDTTGAVRAVVRESMGPLLPPPTDFRTAAGADARYGSRISAGSSGRYAAGVSMPRGM